MMSFFSRRKRPKVIVRADTPAIRADVWVRKRMPDPGAENFAYETFELPPQTVIGPAVAVRHPRTATQVGAQPYFPVQHTSLQGIGQVSGSIKSQPLFNPKYNGYSGAQPLRMNDPMPRSEIIPAGSAMQ